ncbi:MAG: dodecin domain-containing protein [Deltaproteobacteria bacterium]|nr:dodecin domain-containing protein [Deltaproteobacteria bacterium]MBW2673747.1 dodecin domain-containing protein [Deltaproteobacteria bacterium]
MIEQVYKQIEITGSSRKGVQEAIEHAISRASKTIHQIRWFQVTDTRGYIEGEKVSHWQVTLKIGFSVDDPGA